MEQFNDKDYAGGTGTAIATGLGLAGLGKATLPTQGPFGTVDAPLTQHLAGLADFNGFPKKIMQSMSGEGKTATGIAREKASAALVETRKQNVLARNQARFDYEAAEAKNLRETTETNQKAMLDARTKYEAAQAAFERRELMLQGAERSSQNIASQLPLIREQAKAVASALYPDVSGAVDAERVVQGVQSAIDTHLRGVGKVPAVLQRILADAAPTSPMAAIDSGDGLRGMPWSFDKLGGVYSELGRDMFSRDLPGDERATITETYDYIGKLRKELAESAGQGPRFDYAQKNWAKLQDTFYNTDPVGKGGSPLAHALQAMDPITHQLRPEFVQDALASAEGYKYGRQLLVKYPQLQGELDTMYHALNSAKDLPKNAPETATISGLREFEPQSVAAIKLDPEEPFDAKQWRMNRLNKAAEIASGFSKYEVRPVGFKYIPSSRTLANILRNPTMQEFLASDPVAMDQLAKAGLIDSIYVPHPKEDDNDEK